MAAAWHCSARTNAGLIANLTKGALLTDARAEAAMRAVDRADFVLGGGSDAEAAYKDTPQPLGHRATISAPHMHALALSLLSPVLKEGAKVLDVGSGSGYLTACMALMVGPEGRVHGTEIISELRDLGEANVRKHHADLLDSGRVDFLLADGYDGLAGQGPFDAIHVGAAAPSVPPALEEQLAPGGRIIIPVGPDGGAQALTQIDRGADSGVTRKEVMGVRYVPLVPLGGRGGAEGASGGEP